MARYDKRSRVQCGAGGLTVNNWCRMFLRTLLQQVYGARCDKPYACTRAALVVVAAGLCPSCFRSVVSTTETKTQRLFLLPFSGLQISKENVVCSLWYTLIHHCLIKYVSKRKPKKKMSQHWQKGRYPSQSRRRCYGTRVVTYVVKI